jgi:hypothetical protein
MTIAHEDNAVRSINEALKVPAHQKWAGETTGRQRDDNECRQGLSGSGNSLASAKASMVMFVMYSIWNE